MKACIYYHCTPIMLPINMSGLDLAILKFPTARHGNCNKISWPESKPVASKASTEPHCG